MMEMVSHKRGIYVDKECHGQDSKKHKKHKKCTHERKSVTVCPPKKQPHNIVGFFQSFRPQAQKQGLLDRGQQCNQEGRWKKNNQGDCQSFSLPWMWASQPYLGTQRNFKLSDLKILLFVLKICLHCSDEICCCD